MLFVNIANHLECLLISMSIGHGVILSISNFSTFMILTCFAEAWLVFQPAVYEQTKWSHVRNYYHALLSGHVRLRRNVDADSDEGDSKFTYYTLGI